MLVKKVKTRSFPVSTAFYLGGAQLSPYFPVYFKQMKEKSQKRDELREALYALTAVLYILFNFL